MHAVVRQYTGNGAKDLMDVLEARKTDVEALIRGVNGFVAYQLIRTSDGGLSVTICQDKAGTDESLKVASDWIRQNATIAGLAAPTVSEGNVIVQI